MEEKQITLQIDRHYITVPEGSTILEAASIRRTPRTFTKKPRAWFCTMGRYVVY